jgi:hypothetical protein
MTEEEFRNTLSWIIDAYKIVADDGLGHRAGWIVGTEFKKSLPKLPVVIAVLSVCGLIAYIFDKKAKKRGILCKS